MDLITMLTAVTHPGVEAETPDPCDPASTAAFATLLAGLATPPMGPVLVAPTEPGDAAPATVPVLTPPAAVPLVPVDVQSGGEAAVGFDPTAAPNPRLGAPEGRNDLEMPPTPPDQPSTAVATGPADPRPALVAPLPLTSRTPHEATPPVVEPTDVDVVDDAVLAAPVRVASDAHGDEPGSPRPDVHLTHGPPPRAEITPTVTAPTESLASASTERTLATQLVDRIGQLRHGPDGEHELTIQLEPAELGRLELRVRLEAGVVHVHVMADGRDTSDLLRRSLPELRELLADAGLTSGSLDVGHHHGRGGAPNPNPAPAAIAHRAVPKVRSSSDHHRAVDPARGVDVLL